MEHSCAEKGLDVIRGAMAIRTTLPSSSTYSIVQALVNGSEIHLLPTKQLLPFRARFRSTVRG